MSSSNGPRALRSRWSASSTIAAVAVAVGLASCGGGDSAETSAMRADASAAVMPAREQPLVLRLPDASELFDWAERAYAQYFPSHQANGFFAPYTYRYYPETGNYVGLAGDTVAVLGPLSGGEVLVVGKLGEFTCQVLPAECAAPTITLQPQARAVIAPATASFSVAASGEPAPAFRWQSSSDGGTTFVDIPGATAAIYTTPPTTTAGSGVLYRVVLSNAAGSLTSAAAVLTVHASASDYASAPLPATLTTPRAMHAATLLSDGQVLITGGFAAGTFPAPALNSAELYDPATRSFTSLAARMKSPRTSHATARLPDGRVLITGGQVDTNDGDGTDIAEIYDPATRSFTMLAAHMKSPRGAHSATTLASGKVLLASGYYQGPGTLKSDAELYDPATQVFTALAARMVLLRGDGHAAALLADGRVMISGGVSTSPRGVTTDTAEVYDPAIGSFSALPARMTTPRGLHRASTLPSGEVLLSGGSPGLTPGGGTVFRSTEAYDPTTQTFMVLAATLVTPRAAHTATVLADGSVLLTGGIGVLADGNLAVRNDAEVMKPPAR